MNRNGLIDVNCIVEKNQHVKSFNVGIELSEYLAWPVASRLTSSKLLAASGFEAGIKLCLQRCLDYRFDLTIQSMTRVLQVLSYWITFGSCMACEVCVSAVFFPSAFDAAYRPECGNSIAQPHPRLGAVSSTLQGGCVDLNSFSNQLWSGCTLALCTVHFGAGLWRR